MNQIANRQQPDNRQQQQSRALAPIAELQSSRLPITLALAGTLGVSALEWRVLVDQTFPAAKTVEAIALALSYCRHRNLDIFKRPVHIVPMYSASLKRMVETVWPGIAEIRTTATRTGVYAGIDDAEYGPTIDREFVSFADNADGTQREVKRVVSFPAWCRVVVYRLVGGQRCAFHARVFWDELYATAARGTDLPNEMWRKRPFGQIEKCAEAAGLRKAFPEEIGNELSAEEMEGRVLTDASVSFAALPTPAPAPRPPPRPAATATAPATATPGGARPSTAAETPAPPPRPAVPTQAAAAMPEQRQPANVEPEIVDAESEEIVDGGDSGSDFDFFDHLRDELSLASDLASLEEIWTQFDPMARFQNDQHSQKMCAGIKAIQVRRIEAIKR